MITAGQLIKLLKKYPDDIPIWIAVHPSAAICETDVIHDALERVRAIDGHRIILLEGDDQ